LGYKKVQRTSDKPRHTKEKVDDLAASAGRTKPVFGPSASFTIRSGDPPTKVEGKGKTTTCGTKASGPQQKKKKEKKQLNTAPTRNVPKRMCASQEKRSQGG